MLPPWFVFPKVPMAGAQGGVREGLGVKVFWGVQVAVIVGVLDGVFVGEEVEVFVGVLVGGQPLALISTERSSHAVAPVTVTFIE